MARFLAPVIQINSIHLKEVTTTKKNMEIKTLLFGFILLIAGSRGMQPQQYHSNFNGGVEYAEPNSHYPMHPETGYNTQNQGVQISYPYTESWFKANRGMLHNEENSVYKNFAPGVEKHMSMMNNNFGGLKMHESGLSSGYTNNLQMSNKPYIQYKTHMPSHSTGLDRSFVNHHPSPHMQHSSLKIIAAPQMQQHYSSSQGHALHQHGMQEDLSVSRHIPVNHGHSQGYFPQQGLHTHQAQMPSQGHISNMEHPTMHHHIGDSTHGQLVFEAHTTPQLISHSPAMHHQQGSMHKYPQPQGFSAASEVSHVKFNGMGTSYAF